MPGTGNQSIAYARLPNPEGRRYNKPTRCPISVAERLPSLRDGSESLDRLGLRTQSWKDFVGVARSLPVPGGLATPSSRYCANPEPSLSPGLPVRGGDVIQYRRTNFL